MKGATAGPRERAVEAFAEIMRALHSGAPEPWLVTDLTLAQLKTLLFLSVHERASGRELARALGVGPSAVSQLVDRLVAHGHVQRTEAPDDRRITWLTLTERGRGTVERLMLDRRERLAAALDRLAPAEQEQVAAALALLARAARRAHSPEEDARC